MIEEIQERIQQLYDIPLRQFTREDTKELQALLKQASDLGYERADDDTIEAIRYVPKNASSQS